MNLFGVGGNRSRGLSPGRRDSHYTTNARVYQVLSDLIALDKLLLPGSLFTKQYKLVPTGAI